MDTLSPSPARLSLYGQLTDDFRERILSGELKPGEKLPSFTEMRQQHRVSQATLNRVHGLLEAEGLISRRRGAGTFVCDLQGRPESNGANGHAGRVSFLSNAVLILTSFGEPMASHRSAGWLEWIAQGATEAVQQAGMHAVSLSPRITEVEIEHLIAEKPLGALIPANLSESSIPLGILRKLRAHGIAVVAFGSSPDLAECDHVVSDHESGAYQLTRLLLERGKRRIINVQPSILNEAWLSQRQAGYERAMREAGLQAESAFLIPYVEPVLSTRLSSEGEISGFQSQAEVLAEDRRIFESQVRSLAGHFVEAMSGENPVEAMLATTDRNTFTLAAICRLFGKDPDRDVSIAGYDNYFAECEEQAIAPFIPFATIDKNNRALGATLAQLLFERIEGRLEASPQTRCVAPKLIVPAG